MKRDRASIEVTILDKNMRLGELKRFIEATGRPVRVRLEERHYTEPKVIKCPRCGSHDVYKYGVRNNIQEYLCAKCRQKFTARDIPFGMRTPINQVGASLDMYYNGLSLADITRYLKQTHNNPVDRSTVYHWLIRFTREAIRLFEPMKPKVSDTWIADETTIKFQDKLYWIWDIIDRDTRFLLASFLSPNRGTREAKTLMELASERAGKAPKWIITDKLKAYIDGIELVFGAETKHLQTSPFGGVDSTNIIERFQGTVKERTKVLWGFKTPETARLILAGFMVHYNYFRLHISLQKRTPAEVAGIKAPVGNWTELVRKVGI
jgi:transposase-like protein/DNA-directed RNA polymerase subunit RPC12/RpoP